VVLASIVDADGDAIVMLAVGPEQRIVLRRVIDGAPSGESSAPAFWRRGGQFRACVSQRAGSVECTVLVGNGPPIELTLPAGLDAPLAAVRLADRRHGIPAPFAWHGGRLEPHRALDASERLALLRSPSLLADPDGTPGDVDGDNVVDFMDLNLVLSSFGMGGPCLAGDLNADESVDFGDLNTVLSAYHMAGSP
jgi:hypothetical protein